MNRRVINEEGVKFGDLTEEARNEIIGAHNNRTGELFILIKSWEPVHGNVPFHNESTYKLEIEEKEYIPWGFNDFADHPQLRAKGSDALILFNYVNRGAWKIDYHGILEEVSFEELAKNYTLPDGTELYKEVER